MKKNPKIAVFSHLILYSLFFRFAVLETILLFVMRKFSNTTLLFDQIVLSTLLSIVIFFVSDFLSHRRFVISRLKSLLVIGLLIGNFYSYTLMNIDRSRSFYVLNWIDKDKLYFERNNLVSKVASQEANEIDAIEQRVFEHQSRGLLNIENSGKITLTLMGKLTLKISNFFANVFSLQGWFLNRN